MDPAHVPESNGTPDDVALQSRASSAEDVDERDPGITENLHYHPSYPFRECYLAGDLVLVSKDGVHFHVHSIILKLASSFFCEMLDIPRTCLESAIDPIPLEEKAEIIVALLDIVYPSFHTREVTTKQAVKLYAEDLITAADKYDMPAVILFVKNVLFAVTESAPSNASEWSAIRRYDLACRYQWEEEAKLSASWTLRRSLTTDDSLSELERISSRSILQLQKLHRIRLRAMIDSLGPAFFDSLNPVIPNCYCSIIDDPTLLRTNDAWQHFIYTMSNLLKNDPLATCLLLDEKWESYGYAQIFEIKHGAHCSKPNVGSTVLHKNRFIAKVRKKLYSLPTSV